MPEPRSEADLIFATLRTWFVEARQKFDLDDGQFAARMEESARALGLTTATGGPKTFKGTTVDHLCRDHRVTIEHLMIVGHMQGHGMVPVLARLTEMFARVAAVDAREAGYQGRGRVRVTKRLVSVPVPASERPQTSSEPRTAPPPQSGPALPRPR